MALFTLDIAAHVHIQFNYKISSCLFSPWILASAMEDEGRWLPIMHLQGSHLQNNYTVRRTLMQPLRRP